MAGCAPSLLALPILIAVASLPAAQRPAAASADDGGHHRRPSVRPSRRRTAYLAGGAARHRRHPGGAAEARRAGGRVRQRGQARGRDRGRARRARRPCSSSGSPPATSSATTPTRTPTPTALTAEAYLAEIDKGDAVTQAADAAASALHALLPPSDDAHRRHAGEEGRHRQGSRRRAATPSRRTPSRTRDCLFNVAYAGADAADARQARGGLSGAHDGRHRRSPRPRRASCSAATTCRRRCSSTRMSINADHSRRAAGRSRGSRLSLHNARRGHARPGLRDARRLCRQARPELALPVVPHHRSRLEFQRGSRGSRLGHGPLPGSPTALGAIQSEDVHGSHAPPESLGCAHRPHPADRPDPALRGPPPDPRGDHAAGVRRAAPARLEGAASRRARSARSTTSSRPATSPARSRTTWPRP